jgi:hypothetical protein
MPEYLTPGVYVEEVAAGLKSIERVSTTTAAFIGRAPLVDALLNEPTACNNWTEFCNAFVKESREPNHLANAARAYFDNGGSRLYVLNIGTGTVAGDGRRTGIHALRSYEEISTTACPGCTDAADYEALLTDAENCGDRVAICDGPERFDDVKELTEVAGGGAADSDEEGGKSRAKKSKGRRPRDSKYGAVYCPWIWMSDPHGGKQPVLAPPSGFMAGIFARNDVQRGVHKATANYVLAGALGVSQRITREEQGVLNPAGVNCIRPFPGSILIWGARTLSARDAEWRYLNVRRLFNMMGKSIRYGTQWCVFEPNNHSLRMSVKRNIEAFLRLLWRDGAFLGLTQEEAFFVKCDSENNPRDVVDAGRLVVEIGVAVVKPAEFVIFRLSQWAGGAEVEAA